MLNDEQASVVLKGILEGLSYLHLKNIIHRDIKPANILLMHQDDLTSVKLADLGLAAQFDQED